MSELNVVKYNNDFRPLSEIDLEPHMILEDELGALFLMVPIGNNPFQIHSTYMIYDNRILRYYIMISLDGGTICRISNSGKQFKIYGELKVKHPMRFTNCAFIDCRNDSRLE